MDDLEKRLETVICPLLRNKCVGNGCIAYKENTAHKEMGWCKYFKSRVKYEVKT